jgi:hypothetical protein
MLYVDTSTFIFETLDDMMHGGNVIFHHYAEFGLIMHVGREGKKSKTEMLHIPKKLGENPIPLGTKVQMNKGDYYHFTDQIKYLGSVITYCS